MITREMFLEALKKMEEASAVIEAYQMQFSNDSNSKKKYKDHDLVEVGDFVECIQVHSNSKDNLVKGNKYEVVQVYEGHNSKIFYIITENDVKRSYNSKNSQFRLLK